MEEDHLASPPCSNPCHKEEWVQWVVAEVQWAVPWADLWVVLWAAVPWADLWEVEWADPHHR